MYQHHLIMDIIDNFGTLRPPEYHGQGVCFGLTMTGLISLFAGNLKAYEETLDAISETFPDSDELAIRKRILQLDSLSAKHHKSEDEKKLQQIFINITALLSYVAITQTASNYSHIFDNPSLRLTDQILTIHDTSKIILAQSSVNKKTKTMAFHPGFSAFINQESMKAFIASIENKVITQNIPFGCILTLVGHSIGFGYDPDSKTWLLIEIDPGKIISRHACASNMAAAAWKTYSAGKNELAANFIVATSIHFELKNEIDEYYKNELNKIKHYSSAQLCELYANAYVFFDQETFLAIRTQFNIPHSRVNLLSALRKILNEDKFSLQMAIEMGWNTVAEAILGYTHHEHINNLDEKGNTPLLCALKCKNVYMANRISQERNVSVLVTDKDGKSVFYYAALNGFTNLLDLMFAKEVPEKLLSTPTIILPGNLTLFQYAAKFELLSIMDALIKAGVDINERTSDNSTPLHLAAQNGKKESVKKLLKLEKIQINIHNSSGNTPLYDAIANNKVGVSNEIMTSLGKQFTLKDFTLHPKKGWTILHCATAHDVHSIMHKMIDIGADINKPAADKSTPLHLAVIEGKMGAVKILLDAKGINLDARNSENKTPVQCKSKAHHEIIQDLLKDASLSRAFMVFFSALNQPKNQAAPTKKRTFDAT